MEDLFRKYCKFLASDRKEDNLFSEIEEEFKEGKIDFYEFLEKNHSYNKLLYLFSRRLKKSGISEIEINENNVIFTTKILNLKLIFNGKDRRGVPFELLNFGTYEEKEVELIQRISTGVGLHIDIGANIGWFSLILGKSYPNARIISFEPIKESFNYLISNLTVNNIKNVETYCKAVMEKSGTVKFFFSPESSVLSSAENILSYEKASEVLVESVTIDEFLSERDQVNVEMLKCDVEGAEYNVILGGINMIKKSTPVIILELFHEWSKKFNYHPNEVLNFLLNLGYEAFLPLNEGLEKVISYIPEDFSRQNYFFLHKVKHADLIQKFA